MEAIICYSLLAELLAHFWASRTACRYSETPLPLVLYIYTFYISAQDYHFLGLLDPVKAKHQRYQQVERIVRHTVI